MGNKGNKDSLKFQVKASEGKVKQPTPIYEEKKVYCTEKKKYIKKKVIVGYRKP